MTKKRSIIRLSHQNGYRGSGPSTESPSFRLPTWRSAVLPLLGIALAALLASAGHAAAADPPVTGNAVLTVGTGSAGKTLARQKVKLVPAAPARVKRLPGRRYRATLPAVSLKRGGAPVALAGGFRFRRGKRALAVSGMAVTTGNAPVWVTARVGAKRMRLFRVGGKLKVERTWRDLKWHLAAGLRKARLDLTPAAARLLRGRLGLRGLPAGAAGVLSLEASRLEKGDSPPVDIGDPYLAQCGIPALRENTFDFPLAGPVPTLTGVSVNPTGPSLAWGFKKSFRVGYLKMFNGSMHSLNGAGRDDSEVSVEPDWRGFTFPVTGGTWDADSGRSVINTSGTGLFCNPEHHFRVAISNLTIVIDGAASRLIADVDFNAYGNWTTTRRIDLATLDASGITPVTDGSMVTWTGIPATITAAGAEPFCSKGGPPGTPVLCPYQAGAAIDPVTVTIKTGP